jgi:PA domain
VTTHRAPSVRATCEWKQLLSAIAAVTVAMLTISSCDAATPSFSLGNLEHDTEVLSSDAFEGRGPLSPGEDATVAYITTAMKQAGLEPGVHGSYIQPVPMLQAETLTIPAPKFEITGPSGSLNLTYLKDVTLNTRRGSSAIDLKGSEVLFVGYGVNAPERSWNDYAGIDVHGKTVLILVNDPDWKNPLGEGPFGGAAMTYYGRWMYKYEEAARQGAAAAVIIALGSPRSLSAR